MNFRLPHIIQCCLLALLATSCISEPTAQETMAVIDGWMDSDGYPVVVFTASMQPGEGEQSVADKLIRWGKITVSDGDSTVILTGGPDRNYFPPYKYFTYKLKGKPGKTYTLDAEFDDLHATAVCTMPFPTPIDSISLKPIEGEDSLRAATLHFTAPQDTPAYYYLTIRERGKGSRAWPAMMGTASATRPGESVSIPVFHAKNQLDSLNYIPQLKLGQELEINLCRVTEEVYNFWTSYDNAVMFGGSQFLVNTNGDLGGNIRGGLGVWSVQGTSRVYLTVE